KALRVDCDGDVLLASVEQTGAACHTGRRDCFFWKLDNDTARIDKSPLVDPKDLYDH
ncbi:MAG TPA: phosphoribosyl-AMP cyclohydrolase, partial [Alcanivorax sp.]|nr:phosphoribosyl-AMP cyclohydrolase [Alcanivorax sp.]